PPSPTILSCFPTPLPPPPLSTLFPYTTLFRSGKNALLPGFDLRVVRARARNAPDRENAVLSALALRRRQALRLLDHRQLSRSLRSEEHTSELQSRSDLVCRLLLEKKKKTNKQI